MRDSAIYFSQKELFDFLKFYYKIDCTKPTLNRLNINGCTILPNRHLATGSRSASRVYYHPFVALEIVVATLMFRGAFLQLDSDVRTPRFTIDDVFLARINFYLRHHSSLAEFVDGFSFTVPMQHTLDGSEKTLAMEKESWNYVISNSFPKTCRNFGENLPDGYADSYLKFITDVYEVNFKDVLRHQKYTFGSSWDAVDDFLDDRN